MSIPSMRGIRPAFGWSLRRRFPTSVQKVAITHTTATTAANDHHVKCRRFRPHRLGSSLAEEDDASTRYETERFPMMMHVLGSVRADRDNADELPWSAGETLHERPIELRVDESLPLALQLVRHAAGAEYRHLEVFRVGLDRTAYRPSEAEAAVAGRRGMLDDVHAERDHLARPPLGLAEHHRPRHRQSVVDRHLVDDGSAWLSDRQRRYPLRRYTASWT